MQYALEVMHDAVSREEVEHCLKVMGLTLEDIATIGEECNVLEESLAGNEIPDEEALKIAAEQEPEEMEDAADEEIAVETQDEKMQRKWEAEYVQFVPSPILMTVHDVVFISQVSISGVSSEGHLTRQRHCRCAGRCAVDVKCPR